MSFGLTMPLELGGAGKRRVVVDLEVEVGAVGIGCTTADYSAYVDREVFVPSGIRRKVFVPVGALGAAGHLMFRNAQSARPLSRAYPWRRGKSHWGRPRGAT